VANAILDGTSAVMLSGETAKGRYPVEAVRTMAALAFKAEASLHDYGDLQQILPHPAHAVTEAVAQAAITMAAHLRAAAILTLTASGFTSRAISKYRPECPILAVTRSPDVTRKLALNWGVTAMCLDDDGDDERQIQLGVQRAVRNGYVKPGELVVATAGISGEPGSTHLIRVVTAH
jgi:pyruvate kinase